MTSDATEPSIVAVVEVDELEPDLARERAHELGLGDRALLDQQPAERLPAAGLLGQRRVELGLGQQAFVDEQRAERRSVRHSSRLPSVRSWRISALSWSAVSGSHSARDRRCVLGDAQITSRATSRPCGQDSRRPENSAGTRPGRALGAGRLGGPGDGARQVRGRLARRGSTARRRVGSPATGSAVRAGSAGDSTPGPYGAAPGSTRRDRRRARRGARSARRRARRSRPRRGGGGSTMPTAPASTSARSAWQTSSTGRGASCGRGRARVRRPSIATSSGQRSRSTTSSSTPSSSASADRQSSDGMTRLDLAPLLRAGGRARRSRRSRSTGLVARPRRGSSAANRNEPSSAGASTAKQRSTRRREQRRRRRSSGLAALARLAPRSSGRRRCRRRPTTWPASSQSAPVLRDAGEQPEHLRQCQRLERSLEHAIPPDDARIPLRASTRHEARA